MTEIVLIWMHRTKIRKGVANVSQVSQRFEGHGSEKFSGGFIPGPLNFLSKWPSLNYTDVLKVFEWGGENGDLKSPPSLGPKVCWKFLSLPQKIKIKRMLASLQFRILTEISGILSKVERWQEMNLGIWRWISSVKLLFLI